MGIGYDPEFADVMNDAYVSGSVSVSTSQVEAKVGANRLTGREVLHITNKGTNRVYFGPSGVTVSTGDFLEKNQSVAIAVGDGIGVFLICDTGQSATVIVQEIA